MYNRTRQTTLRLTPEMLRQLMLLKEIYGENTTKVISRALGELYECNFKDMNEDKIKSHIKNVRESCNQKENSNDADM